VNYLVCRAFVAARFRTKYLQNARQIFFLPSEQVFVLKLGKEFCSEESSQGVTCRGQRPRA
jgi:hypothetical protein